MKLNNDNILTLPISKNDRRLLLDLLDDLEEINRQSNKNLYIDWQEYHDEYSPERTDPCPDYYGMYGIYGNEMIGFSKINIDQLDEALCLLYDFVNEK